MASLGPEKFNMPFYKSQRSQRSDSHLSTGWQIYRISVRFPRNCRRAALAEGAGAEAAFPHVCPGKLGWHNVGKGLAVGKKRKEGTEGGTG